MKIGILTFHKAHNYGAVLQCYAMQEFLRSKGHSVFVIDYKQEIMEGHHKFFHFHQIKKALPHPRALVRYVLSFPKRIKRERKFHQFLKSHISLTAQCDAKSIPQDFDLYIVGSDQLWSLGCVGKAFARGEEDPVYMGNFRHAETSKIITYAVSTNSCSLETIGSDKLQEYAQNFSAISFREENLAKLMEQYCQQKIYVSLDPTLLHPQHIWKPLINDKWKNKKYLIYYQLRSDRKGMLKTSVQSIARKHELEFIDFSDMMHDVEDFVTAIKYARCIITSSFHATVFSLIFEKAFYAVELEDGHDDRYVDLLTRLNATEALIKCNKVHSLPPALNYENINRRLEELRSPSFQYLEQNLA